jgi:deoxyribodipyrimidine photolyase-related protein
MARTARPPRGAAARTAVRRLVIILGDQLNADAAVFDDFDPAQDLVWMAEVAAESRHVPSHKARTALFLSAMRHFRDRLIAQGARVHYRALGTHTDATLSAALRADLPTLDPREVVAVTPGEHRLLEELTAAAAGVGRAIHWLEDRHFVCTRTAFADWARGRKVFRLEHFYRWMRRETGVLMQGDEPEGGQFNFDADNRAAFPPSGPGFIERPRSFVPDACTREVLALVAREFHDHPGSLEHFDWPVTREDALAALHDFMRERLPLFGRYQDAMWGREPYLYHSRLSSALNLKLLSPREVIDAAVDAYRSRHAPLEAVEGFVRQILGWREYVRGVYWLRMPEYATLNALDAHEPLPDFYWHGHTEFACLNDTLEHTLGHGYAHHIERLMVTGLFALLLGVEPREIHRWYLAIYTDAVEWVELPNVIGMSQHADGGFLASKPYIASGKYIDRMSDHCRRCPRRPDEATGDRACPFTTLYWDFLARHEARLAGHPRLGQQVKHWRNRSASARSAIREEAAALRARLKAH